MDFLRNHPLESNNLLNFELNNLSKRYKTVFRRFIAGYISCWDRVPTQPRELTSWRHKFLFMYFLVINRFFEKKMNETNILCFKQWTKLHETVGKNKCSHNFGFQTNFALHINSPQPITARVITLLIWNKECNKVI